MTCVHSPRGVAWIVDTAGGGEVGIVRTSQLVAKFAGKGHGHLGLSVWYVPHQVLGHSSGCYHLLLPVFSNAPAWGCALQGTPKTKRF